MLSEGGHETHEDHLVEVLDDLQTRPLDACRGGHHVDVRVDGGDQPGHRGSVVEPGAGMTDVGT